MATEYEELRLTVTLVDNASAPLTKIQEQLKGLGSGEHKQAFEGLTKQTKELANAFKPMGEGVEKMAEKLFGFARAGGAAATSILGIAGAIYEAAKSAASFAGKIADLGAQARSLNMGSAQLRLFQEAFARSGVEAGRANATIRGLIETHGELTKVNSRTRNELIKGAGAYADQMRELLAKAPYQNQADFINSMRDALELIRKNAEEVGTAHGLDPSAAKDRAGNIMREFSAIIRAPDLVQLQEKVRAATEEEEKAAKSRNEAADEFIRKSQTIRQEWEAINDVWDAKNLKTLNLVLGKIAEVITAYRKWNDEQEAAEKKRNEAFAQRWKEHKERVEQNPKLGLPWQPGGPSIGEWLRGVFTGERGETGISKGLKNLNSMSEQLGPMPLLGNYDRWNDMPASSNIEDRRGEVEDHLKALNENTIQLKRLNDAIALPGKPGAGGGLGLFGGNGAGTGGDGGGDGGGLAGVGPRGAIRIPRHGGGAPNGNDSGPGSGPGAGETAPDSTPEGIKANLAAQRARFAEELKAKPWLREKLLAIGAGENRDPAANQSVFEETMNRAAVSGHSLEQEARTTAEGGYYAGYNPGALRNAKFRAASNARLNAALEGSNVSNFATDNSSGGLAEREGRSGRFKLQFSSGGEYFWSPGTSGNFSRSKWLAWRNRMMTPNGSYVGAGGGKGAGQTPVAGPAPIDDPYAAGVEMLKQRMPATDESRYASGVEMLKHEMGGGDPRYAAGVEMLRHRMARSDIDRQMTHRVQGSGTIDVNVNAPKGTGVMGKSGGLFNKVQINRNTQMEPAATSLAGSQ